jgi:hypothetical protein
VVYGVRRENGEEHRDDIVYPSRAWTEQCSKHTRVTRRRSEEEMWETYGNTWQRTGAIAATDMP